MARLVNGRGAIFDSDHKSPKTILDLGVGVLMVASQTQQRYWLLLLLFLTCGLQLGRLGARQMPLMCEYGLVSEYVSVRVASWGGIW